MSKQSSVALLGAMAMMSTQSIYTNAYGDLTNSDTQYSGGSRVKPKIKLTKKQMKSREKSKRARKARKR